MRYILNGNGYLQEVSFGADIECNGKACTEYTGGVPSGYSSLADWFSLECDKLYRWKIVGGQLTLDTSVALLPDPLAPCYGLGGSAIPIDTSVDNLSNISATNLYTWNSAATAADRPFISGGELLSLKRNEAIHSQIAFGHDTYDTQIVARKVANGVAREWEHLNPELRADVEYRTLERLHGKAVYKKADSKGCPMYRVEGEDKWHGQLSVALVWTNIKPSDTFVAQTVPIPELSGYDYVFVEFGESWQGTAFVRVGKNGGYATFGDLYTAGSGYFYVVGRDITVTTSGVSFGHAIQKYANSNYTETDNSKLIPYKIYGIKGATE